MLYSIVNELIDNDGGTAAFEAKVNAAVNDDWEPVGAPFHIVTQLGRGLEKRMYQAMVKYVRGPWPTDDTISEKTKSVGTIGDLIDIESKDNGKVGSIVTEAMRPITERSGNPVVTLPLRTSANQPNAGVTVKLPQIADLPVTQSARPQTTVKK